MGPNMPYPLRDGFQTTSIAPRKIRLQLRPIAESYAKNPSYAPKMWCYDVCYEPHSMPDDRWVPVYCFAETEFLPQDYETMSWFTSTHPSSFFTKYVTCTKMLMERARENIIGNIALFGATVKESVGTSRMVVRECATEAERVRALEVIFDVHLTDVEKNGISPRLRLGRAS